MELKAHLGFQRIFFSFFSRRRFSSNFEEEGHGWRFEFKLNSLFSLWMHFLFYVIYLLFSVKAGGGFLEGSG